MTRNPVAIYLYFRRGSCSAIALLGMFFCFAGCGGSNSVGNPSSNSSLTFSTSPSSLVLVPSSTVTLTVTASTFNTAGTPTLTSIQAPTGITSITPLPLSVPSGGASLTLQISSSAKAGSLTLSGQVGTTMGSGQVPITIDASFGSNFAFGNGETFELQVPIGGSGQIALPTASDSEDFNVTFSASGLPSGVAASFTPSTIIPGQLVTLTLTASSTAPAAQISP